MVCTVYKLWLRVLHCVRPCYFPPKNPEEDKALEDE